MRKYIRVKALQIHDKYSNLLFTIIFFLCGIVILMLLLAIVPMVPEIKEAFDGFERENIKEFQGGFGFTGLVFAFGLQIIATLSVIFPIATVPLLIGAIYGPTAGAIISSLGMAAAHCLALMLARRYKAVERIFFLRWYWKKYSFLEQTKHTSQIVFILFFVPVLPTGLLPYICAKSKIEAWRYALTIFLASLPSFYIWSHIGSSLILGRFIDVGFTGGPFLLTIGIMFLMRNKIIKMLKKIGGIHRDFAVNELQSADQQQI